MIIVMTRFIFELLHWSSLGCDLLIGVEQRMLSHSTASKKLIFDFCFVETGRSVHSFLSRLRIDLSLEYSRLGGEPSSAIGSFKSHEKTYTPFLEQLSDRKILFRVLRISWEIVCWFVSNYKGPTME